jgi:solute carrier family 25 phosphate transporter 3
MWPSVTCRSVYLALLSSKVSHSFCEQVNPAKYKGLTSGLATLIREEGQTGIWKGFGSTFVGYSLQGMFKYGLYEVFKDQYMNLAGEELSNKYKPAIWLAGSASAEVFADIALCPLEMTKVKIQTSPTGTFPTAFGAALAEMSRTKVETRYPFGSLVPLWSRQVSCVVLVPIAFCLCMT